MGMNSLEPEALCVISQVFHITPDKIKDISVLKNGMTNRSFLFSINGEKFIIRTPGIGTERLINRLGEFEAYKTISGLGLCDDPIYINPSNGYKITKYLKNVRNCDKDNLSDLEKCMKKLRYFHSLNLHSSYNFDIFERINFYESLWDSSISIYEDYNLTKANVFSLRQFIDNQNKQYCLTHIDAVPDNFLFYLSEAGEDIQLTDWEYAGMQDPHVDIAMFCIYSLYRKEQVDKLIDIYFQNECSRQTRAKIYAYIASCGLLWSNWCEFKMKLGIEFGEYSALQYQFAKDFYRFSKNEAGEM